jgi:hypothetical protein
MTLFSTSSTILSRYSGVFEAWTPSLGLEAFERQCGCLIDSLFLQTTEALELSMVCLCIS